MNKAAAEMKSLLFSGDRENVVVGRVRVPIVLHYIVSVSPFFRACRRLVRFASRRGHRSRLAGWLTPSSPLPAFAHSIHARELSPKTTRVPFE